MDNISNNFNGLKSLLDVSFVQQLNHIAKSAGQAILKVYSRDFVVEIKSDESPLTEADLASHKAIVSSLSKLTPEIPILSEESAEITWAERWQWQTYWLIDPLDGTKGFIKRNDEFTVNIALIHNNTPIVGVVYAPALDLLYFASERVGAFKQIGEKEPEAIQAAGEVKNRPYKVMDSRSYQSEEFATYIEQFEAVEVVSMGSSLKLCYVAEGKADIYPRLGSTSEWDTAAAHAVVRYAGGQCLNYETDTELEYNTKDSLLNPYFIVTGFTDRQGEN